MEQYLAEFVGTLLLVFMGDGVCANVSLEKSNFQGSGPVFIVIGWGLAVALPAMAFGGVSGAHYNPALTIALATIGSFDWSMVPGYIIAQMLGGFCGAVLVWVVYKPHFDITEDKDAIRGSFCTTPGIRSMGANIVGEAAATFMLLFLIVAIGNAGSGMNGIATGTGMNYWFVAAIIMTCGYSLGGTTGFAMNPARDTAPRFAHSILPIPNKGDSDWGYAIVPIIGSIVGGILGAVVANGLIGPNGACIL